MKTGYTVMDLMTNEPVKMQVGATIKQVATTMKEKSVGSVLVMEGTKLTGIITEKDIVTKITANGKSAVEKKAFDIMTPYKELVTIKPNVDILEAINMMKKNEIRRLPVMDNNELKGIITTNDILKIEPTLFDLFVEKIRIREEDRKLNVNSEEDESFDEDEE